MLDKWLKEALDASRISQAELSRQLSESLGRSIDRAAVNKMVKGTRKIAADELLVIQNVTGTHAPGETPEPNAIMGEKVQLLRQKIRVIESSDKLPDNQDSESEPATLGSVTGRRGIDDDEIPEIDVTGGLGGGGIPVTNQVTANSGLSFAAEVIADRWHVPSKMFKASKAAHVAAIPVEGDSMTPTILNGDVVFIDTRRRQPSPEGLYALVDEFGGLVVKRLELSEESTDEFVRVSIISDNPHHSTRIRNLEEITIVGLVIGRFTTT